LGCALFPRDRLLQVDLTVAPADWERLRHEGRTLNEIYSGCFKPAFTYTTVPAGLVVDGQSFEQVGIRNRGLIGSISTLKPSLRIDMDEYRKEAVSRAALRRRRRRPVRRHRRRLHRGPAQQPPRGRLRKASC
jgi:hypothetical protein